MSEDLAWPTVGRSLLLLALVWWAWSAFVWAANAEEENSRLFRVVLLVALVMMFLAGVVLPSAFRGEAAAFVASYAAVRFLHLGIYADASRRGHASLTAIAGFGRRSRSGWHCSRSVPQWAASARWCCGARPQRSTTPAPLGSHERGFADCSGLRSRTSPNVTVCSSSSC